MATCEVSLKMATCEVSLKMAFVKATNLPRFYSLAMHHSNLLWSACLVKFRYHDHPATTSNSYCMSVHYREVPLYQYFFSFVVFLQP